jgi:hypothetical protein
LTTVLTTFLHLGNGSDSGTNLAITDLFFVPDLYVIFMVICVEVIMTITPTIRSIHGLSQITIKGKFT